MADRDILIIGAASMAGQAVAAALDNAGFNAIHGDPFMLPLDAGCDLLGDPGPRSDERCRSHERALADRAKLNADQPESRQVRRARERAERRKP
jgi:nucleoside-diphosphate-sugar epimerase